jgi:hypothetical protein
MFREKRVGFEISKHQQIKEQELINKVIPYQLGSGDMSQQSKSPSIGPNKSSATGDAKQERNVSRESKKGKGGDGKENKDGGGGGKKKDEGKFAELPGAEMGKVVVRFPPEASG